MPRTAWPGLPPGPSGKNTTSPCGTGLHQCPFYKSHAARNRDRQLALWRSRQERDHDDSVRGQSSLLNTKPYSSGSEPPTTHTIFLRKGQELPTWIGHLEDSPRTILEFACDIHHSPQQGHLSETLRGLNPYDCSTPPPSPVLFLFLKFNFLELGVGGTCL